MAKTIHHTNPVTADATSKNKRPMKVTFLDGNADAVHAGSVSRDGSRWAWFEPHVYYLEMSAGGRDGEAVPLTDIQLSRAWLRFWPAHFNRGPHPGDIGG